MFLFFNAKHDGTFSAKIFTFKLGWLVKVFVWKKRLAQWREVLCDEKARLTLSASGHRVGEVVEFDVDRRHLGQVGESEVGATLLDDRSLLLLLLHSSRLASARALLRRGSSSHRPPPATFLSSFARVSPFPRSLSRSARKNKSSFSCRAHNTGDSRDSPGRWTVQPAASARAFAGRGKCKYLSESLRILYIQSWEKHPSRQLISK